MARNPSDQLSKARDHLQQANVPAALALVEGVLRKAPASPDANYLLGVIRLMSGDAMHAIAPLELTLRADPHNGATLDHLGLCYLMQGRFGDAEAVLQRAATKPNAPAVVVMRLGLALLHQEKSAAAIACLQRAVALAPQDADCHMNLARALHQGGQADAARGTFERALVLAPGNPDVLFNLGVLCLEQDQLEAAAGWFKQAVARAPRHADAWVNLGIVQERQQDPQTALLSYRKALEIEPRLAAAGSNLAHALASLNRHEEARLQYLATLQHAPQFVAAHEGLAAVCLTLGRMQEAIVHLRTTVQAEPANHGALLMLAKALLETGHLDEAEPLTQRACELNATSVGAYWTRATLLSLRGEIDQAVGVLEAGYARTNDGELLGMLTFNYRQLCDWPKWEQAWAALAPRVDTDSALGSPFWLLCEPTTALQQRTYNEAWAATRFKNIQPLLPRGVSPSAHERIRIGYLSSDLQEHATAYLIADVLEHHDAARFEVFAYSHGPEDHSPMRQRLRAACEHFVDIAWDTDDAAAQRIRDDEIDILVDLKGYTVGDRVTILARRPCEIQVTWLGFPGTTGTPFVDYAIADPYLIRPEDEVAYVERIVRMPHCYQPNDRKRVVAEPLGRQEYDLPDRSIVFCCFNQTYKITPEVFAVWMRLLQRVPDAVLWLLAGGATSTKNLQDAAHTLGGDPQRLVFAPRRPNAEHLARYRVADIALDTFPYTSHTTLSDALWCGCPMVGLAGETFAARVSGSILTAAGLSELICPTIADYEALAYRLATEAPLLARLRTKTEQARDNGPLFDSQTFAHDLEGLYDSMMARRSPT